MKLKLWPLNILLIAMLTSCGEEVLTNKTQKVPIDVPDIQVFAPYDQCSNFRFVKPPVDILFVVDNSKSTLADSFDAIKGQIANTVNLISKEFNFHVYIAPLKPYTTASSELTTYPLIISQPDEELDRSTLNIVSIDSISSVNFFKSTVGASTEYGFKRVKDILAANQDNGVFRKESNIVVVMISNEDDNETIRYTSTGGGSVKVMDLTKFNQRKTEIINEVTKPKMQAESFRFISLVPFSNCYGWDKGLGMYRRMSAELYDYFGITDDGSLKNSRDLCSRDYASLFSVVNNSIRQEIVGHKYDHWLISTASESSIEASDIKVTKFLPDNSAIEIVESKTNGFEYLGYKSGINTRYATERNPSDPGEPVSGLVIKLNGSARVNYPECIRAVTRSPTEYFGYVVIRQEPELSTLRIVVNGKDLTQASGGWTYLGYREQVNIKVPGPTEAAITPELLKTGFVIKLADEHIYTNGDAVDVYFKVAPK